MSVVMIVYKTLCLNVISWLNIGLHVVGSGDYYCSGNDLGNFANIPPDGVKAMAEEGGRILE